MLLAPLLVCKVSEARGDTAELELTGPTECAAALAALKARLADVEERFSNEGLRASIAIDASGAGYRVTLSTTRAGTVAGQTLVTAPTCQEAADVAAVVLALAAGSAPHLGEPFTLPAAKLAATEPEPPEQEPPRSKAPRSTPRPAQRNDRERSPLFDSEIDSVGTRRFALSLGVDAGTLSIPTLVAAAGLAKSFAALELRGGLRYGFATVDEELDDGTTESRRSEFGALEARACYGTSSKLRVAACGGAELGFVWSSHRVESAAGLGASDSAISPRLSGVVAAMVAHRGGRIQPELECSGSGVALGREAGAARVVLRVSAGAAVAF